MKRQRCTFDPVALVQQYDVTEALTRVLREAPDKSLNPAAALVRALASTSLRDFAVSGMGPRGGGFVRAAVDTLEPAVVARLATSSRPSQCDLPAMPEAGGEQEAVSPPDCAVIRERIQKHRTTWRHELANKHIARIPGVLTPCLLYTSPSPRDRQKSRMPSSA